MTPVVGRFLHGHGHNPYDIGYRNAAVTVGIRLFGIKALVFAFLQVVLHAYDISNIYSSIRVDISFQDFRFRLRRVIGHTFRNAVGPLGKPLFGIFATGGIIITIPPACCIMLKGRTCILVIIINVFQHLGQLMVHEVLPYLVICFLNYGTIITQIVKELITSSAHVIEIIFGCLVLIIGI